MLEAPSDSNESARSQYEKLLTDSIHAAERYEKMSGDEDDENFDGDAKEMAADHLQHLMAQRVDILKRVERLRTIEDAFPLVRSESEGERKKHDATQMIEQILSGSFIEEDMRVAARTMVGPERKELTADQIRDFLRACRELAEQNGYAFESKGTFLILTKGDMRFSLKYFAFPSGFGVFGDSRISGMSSWREGERADGKYVFDDGTLLNACTDPEMQRELDRIVAVFK